MILYIENPKDATRKLLELINEFTKVQDTKLIHRNLFHFFFVSFLAILHGLQDLSSLTRDRTHALSSENMESQPLDCQGIPRNLLHFYTLTRKD